MSKLTIIFYTVIVLFIFYINYIDTEQWMYITVTDKEQTVKGIGESIRGKYLIYTDKEVFENTNSFLSLKFNSFDIQEKLKIGNKYRIKVIGWKVPFLSMHRNIINIEQ